jgi:Ulp1 family protease
MANIARYLDDEYLKQRQVEPTGSWAHVVPPHQPSQNNGSDCGVFVCTTALFLSEDIRQSLISCCIMPDMRRRIAYCCMQDRIVRDDD